MAATPQESIREYFDSLYLEIRTIGATDASTQTSLFGRTLESPVFISALSGLGNVADGGAAASAQGAKDAGCATFVGIGDEAELDSILATGVNAVKIVKPFTDTGMIYARLKHAEKAGAVAVGMDTDFFFGSAGKPGYAMDWPVRPFSRGEMEEFVKATSLPFVFKGILSQADADNALQAGAGALFVSHHGGVLDSALPPMAVLPEIVKLADGRVPVFVDCGFQKGSDIFKALAFGASGVGIGRPVLEHLKNGGAKGVTDYLVSLTSQLARVMSLTGCRDIASIDRSAVRTI